MGIYKPRAYAQGDLDYLCGLYAVINTVRHTIGPVQRFGGGECLWLFERLIAELARRRLLAPTMMHGMNQRHISVLLRASQSLLAARFGFSVSVRKPFHRRSRVSRPRFVAAMADHQQPGAAALLGIGPHWSAVQCVTPAGLRLLDSLGPHHLRFDRIAVGCRRRPDEEDREWIRPSSLHLLEYRDELA